MARADAASASIRPDSIKGLAQSVANPAYRRLLIAEPTLRRAVPVLIVAFLITVGVGAIVQVLEHRRLALTEAITDIETIADVVGDRVDREQAGRDIVKVDQAALERAVPPRATRAGQRILLSDKDGLIIAAQSAEPADRGRHLLDIIGRGQAVTTFGARAGVMEIMLPDGTPAFATVRPLNRPLGQLAIVQSRSNALRAWRSDTALTITLFTTTGFVLLILGFAFHWQATRAREADVIYDTVRSRIDTALNSGRCGLWDWDLARGRIFWSHSMFEILGLEPREELLTFGEVSMLVHPHDVQLYELAAQLADAKATSIDHAFRMRHSRGDWVWLRARCELVEQTGEPGVHVIGIAVDITEQKNLAERTVAADIRLRDAIETISEAFVVWDADNRLVLCNSKFQSLHNLPDDAVAAGVPYENIVAAGSQPVVRTQLAGGGRHDKGGLTFEAQLDDGRWLQISERRTKDGGFVSVGTDITLLKRHEEKLLESEKQLVAMVVDLRTSQQTLERQAEQLALLAEKYSQEKTRAEEANHAKSEFLANMSHELRTPLNAIIGFSEIMESGVFGPLGEKYYEYCRDIRESGRYLLEVINDILDMSKIEAGAVHLNLEEFKLDALLAETVRIVVPRAQDKRLAVSTEIAQDIVINADRRGFKQIILNLLSNAVKFTPAGGRVTVRAERSDGSVSIAIEDTGIGIPEGAMKNLGRPFEQVQSQFTKSHQGSGLGLAIAKSLTELHGGTMLIRSTLGVGTTVLVSLPGDGRPRESERAPERLALRA
jgi:two-component system cell cycle sensor histidine kinase PleC